MSKNKRPPLSKQIGLWDNASNDKQQIQNTIGEMRRAFNKDEYMLNLLINNQLQLNVRGSLTKNNDIAKSSDIDIQAVFPNSIDLPTTKDTCELLLQNAFGKKISLDIIYL